MASDIAPLDHHGRIPSDKERTALSLCERDHRLRLRFARTPQGEHILLHIDNYYQDKPDFDQLNGIDNINTVVWIDTDYCAYRCNQSAYKSFIKIGNIFLDKRSFHKYNLWLISRYNTDYSCSDDSDEQSERDNQAVPIRGVSFLLKMIRREMMKISSLPDAKCPLQQLVFPTICNVEITKKEKKNKMKNDHSDKITAKPSRALLMPEQETRAANPHPAADKKPEDKTDLPPVNQTDQVASPLKSSRKRQRDEETNHADAAIDAALSVLPLVKRQKAEPAKTSSATHHHTASNNSLANQQGKDSSQIKSTSNKSKKNQITAIKVISPGKPDAAGSLKASDNLTTRKSKRKKVKRPNIVVSEIDPQHSLYWNMGSYIVNTFFNDTSCKVDSKEMLQKFSKKAKRRRDRICHLWQKYGKAFFDAQYLANASCYVEVSSQMLQHDLDITSDYETIVKILNGIDARFNTSVQRNMINDLSFESRFTLHVKDFFDLLRHLDDELMADWYEIYYKNQILYRNASASSDTALSRDDEKMDVDDE